MSELSIVQQKIFELRGRWVILDRDLAVMYGVTTSALNQAVKRNIKRFPPDFMFQLTTEETQRADTQRVGFFFCLRTNPPHGSPPYSRRLYGSHQPPPRSSHPSHKQKHEK